METVAEESEEQQAVEEAAAVDAADDAENARSHSSSRSSRSRGTEKPADDEADEAGNSAEIADEEEPEGNDRLAGVEAPAVVSASDLKAADKDTASEDGPARLFRSGKGPAEQAYELFLREMAQWTEQQADEAARQKQLRGHGHGRAARLSSLDLDSSGSDTDLEDATEAPKEVWTGLARSLEKLYTRACSTYQVTALTQFKLQLTTKHLSITNMSLRHRDIAAMCIPLEHKDDLTYIDLSGNLIGYKGLESLLNVAKDFRSLANLDLSNNSLGSEAAQLLAAKAENLRALRVLNVTGNHFLERDAEHIATLLTQLESLRVLNASCNTFGSHGGELIGSALSTNGSLENLCLANCEIRMSGAVAIGMALRDNGSLDVLDLSYNGFSDLGAKAVAEGLKTNNALTVLNLTSNRIFIEGAKAIGAMLAVNETLRELYLDKNSFTNEGAQDIIAKLKENENTALKILDMKSVSVTYKTAAAALPTVQQPLLVRFESFVREPGRLREQLGIPTGSGGCVPLEQKLQAEAAHVLRVFTKAQRLNLVRLAREETGGRGRGGGGGGGDGLTEAEMRRLLASLPVGLLKPEVDTLIDSLRGEPDEDGNYTFSLNSLLTLGDPQPLVRMETQH